MTKTFTEAIASATEHLLLDKRTHVLGLGATYNNGLDGTMRDFAVRFPGQVHDTPCSEAAVTGMAIGMAINGLRPIVHHGRIEFALYAMNQILTEAASWEFMFGGDYPCPLVIRIAMGRQWGNGPAHTRNLKSLFAVPGLKVVCPSNPYFAHRLLEMAYEEPSPVIYLEPRWLYKMRGDDSEQRTKFPDTHSYIPISRAQVIVPGSDTTVVAVGEMVLEAVKAAKFLRQFDVNIEVIDLVSIYPIDMTTIYESVYKTGALITADASTPAYSVAHEIIGSIGYRGITGHAVTCKDTPCPTAPSLAADYYPNYIDIARAVTGDLYPHNETFNELHLPPTDDFDKLVAELQ